MVVVEIGGEIGWMWWRIWKWDGDLRGENGRDDIKGDGGGDFEGGGGGVGRAGVRVID